MLEGSKWPAFPRLAEDQDLQDRECNADVSEVGISSEQQFSREVQETKLEKMKCKEEVRYWDWK